MWVLTLVSHGLKNGIRSCLLFSNTFVRNERNKYASLQNSADLHEILFNSLFSIVKGELIFSLHYTLVVWNTAHCIIASINVVLHGISTNTIHPLGAMKILIWDWYWWFMEFISVNIIRRALYEPNGVFTYLAICHHRMQFWFPSIQLGELNITFCAVQASVKTGSFRGIPFYCGRLTLEGLTKRRPQL